MSQAKVPVTMRALLQRINRRLAPAHLGLKKTRGADAIDALGAYYVVNYQTNALVNYAVDVAAFAQDLGVLQPWEMVCAETP